MPVKTGVQAGFEYPGADPEKKKKAPSKPASTAGTGDPHSVKPDAPAAPKKKQPYGTKNNSNMM